MSLKLTTQSAIVLLDVSVDRLVETEHSDCNMDNRC